MKNVSSIALVFLTVFIISACSKGSRFQLSYPSVEVGEALETGVGTYVVNTDEETGALTLTVTSVSSLYKSLIYQFSIESDKPGVEIDTQIALGMKKDQSQTFTLPFDESDLPLKIMYAIEPEDSEQYYDVPKAIINSWGFNVTHSTPKKKPKVEEVAPPRGQIKI